MVHGDDLHLKKNFGGASPCRAGCGGSGWWYIFSASAWRCRAAPHSCAKTSSCSGRMALPPRSWRVSLDPPPPLPPPHDPSCVFCTKDPPPLPPLSAPYFPKLQAVILDPQWDLPLQLVLSNFLKVSDNAGARGVENDRFEEEATRVGGCTKPVILFLHF